jgi:hypothetical protein
LSALSDININKNMTIGMAMREPERPVNAIALQLNANKQKKMRLGSDMGASIPPQRANFLNRGTNRKKDAVSPPHPKIVPKMMFSVFTVRMMPNG